jgi:hypothetical protein
MGKAEDQAEVPGRPSVGHTALERKGTLDWELVTETTEITGEIGARPEAAAQTGAHHLPRPVVEDTENILPLFLNLAIQITLDISPGEALVAEAMKANLSLQQELEAVVVAALPASTMARREPQIPEAEVKDVPHGGLMVEVVEQGEPALY